MSVFLSFRRRAELAAFRKACRQIGDDLFVDGTPTVVEWFGGHIEIGDRFRFSSRPVPSHMYSAGLLKIGDDVWIGHGAAIAATRRVTIGDRTHIGPFLVLMDTDFHGERARPGARLTTDTAISDESGYAPVAIGSDVRIGAQVTILRGSTIGDGATIASGSVVNGRIPDGVYAAGVPARPLQSRDLRAALVSEAIDVAEIAARVFGLAAPPAGDEGPNEISEWDSLGSLKLLLALEDALGRAVDADAFAGASTIGEVQQVVDRVAR